MAFFRDREKPNPSGYELVDVTVYRKQRLHELELFLPATPTTESLVRSLKSKAHEAQAQAQLEAKALEQVDVSMVTPAAKKASASNNRREIESDTDRNDMRVRSKEDETSLSETHRQVYEWDAPLSLLDDTQTPDTDLQTRNEGIFKKLKKLGHMRRIARPESELVFDALTILRERQPHFSDVINFVRQHLRLLFAQGKPLHLPPMLLLGEPGVGKTLFTQQLAAAVQTPMYRQGFDNTTTGSTFTGSDRHFGNTSYGLMFELLCLNEIINPIILLDEIDKASDTQHRNPTLPLHTLLEPVSAGHTIDLSVGLTFNASFVTWVAAANDASRIHASLRSRFIEFFILPPLGHHAIQVAKNIAESVYLDLNVSTIERVPSNITKQLAHLTAREQIQLLKRAFASAFDEKRKCIELKDFPKEIFNEDTDDSDDSEKYTLH